MIQPQLQDMAVPVEKLHTMPGNPRRGDVDAVARSYSEFGQRKPIVALRDGTVIDGNHQLMAAKQLGWKEIAVVYVDDDDLRAKAYALAANRTSDLGHYDDIDLAAMLKDVAADSDLLAATGYEHIDLDALLSGASPLGGSDEDDDGANRYTTEINVPQYEIVGESPTEPELYDRSKADQLQQQIDSADLPEPLRQFLTLATYRHIVFNYRKIAEFYPHQIAAVQRLMEDSALVIIDFDDAMRNGYVRMSQTLDNLRNQDAKT